MEKFHTIAALSVSPRRACWGMALLLSLMACDSRPPEPEETVWRTQTEALKRAQDVEQQLNQAEKRTRAASELDAAPAATTAE